jgi:ferredoxin-thioredoxin reductase catalytic chain
MATNHPQFTPLGVGSAVKQVVQFLFGIAFLFIGGLLVLTIWLLPVGVVVALLGFVLILSASPRRESEPRWQRVQQRDKQPASANAVRRMLRYIWKYQSKTGTARNPQYDVSQKVLLGLARNYERYGRPLCPCVHNPDEQIEIDASECWLCPCEEMRQCKYCHCLMFVSHEGLPITEHLPADHPGRKLYGHVKDPAPDRGRETRKCAEGCVVSISRS